VRYQPIDGVVDHVYTNFPCPRMCGSLFVRAALDLLPPSQHSCSPSDIREILYDPYVPTNAKRCLRSRPSVCFCRTMSLAVVDPCLRAMALRGTKERRRARIPSLSPKRSCRWARIGRTGGAVTILCLQVGDEDIRAPDLGKDRLVGLRLSNLSMPRISKATHRS
jgi:hypothetical protein